MAKAIHMMVRVLDEERSVRFYREVLDLGVADRFEFDGFVLLYLRNDENDFEVELVVNKGSQGSKGSADPYDLGSGYGHVAFAVDDLDAEHGRLDAMGYAPGEIKELEQEGRRLARYFFVHDPDGYQIELLQREGRYR